MTPLVEHIRRVIPNVLAIYAYGSRVRDEQHPDLALLLLRDSGIPALDLAQLEGDLESMASFPVEISVLAPETQTVHSKEVVTGGQVVFVGDRLAVDEFETNVCSIQLRAPVRGQDPGRGGV